MHVERPRGLLPTSQDGVLGVLAGASVGGVMGAGAKVSASEGTTLLRLVIPVTDSRASLIETRHDHGECRI